MAVSNPASLSSIRTTFGGTGRFSEYVRNAGLVPTNSSTANISTTADGLRMSTFNNAVNTSPPTINGLNFSGYYSGPNTLYNFSGSKNLQPQGGNGSYTYAVTNVVSSSNVTSPNFFVDANQGFLYASGRITTGGTFSADGFVQGTVTVTSAGMSNSYTIRHNVSYERTGGGVGGGVSTMIL